MDGGPSIQQITDPLISNEEEISSSNSRSNIKRYIALIFVCFLGFGPAFCYDNPAALEDQIKQNLNVTTTQYSLLYSMYSWPNVILCFLGGFFIDRFFGIQLGTNIYSSLVLIGQILFATGALLEIFWIMALGRLVFGIGSESLFVAQNKYSVLWFKEKELNLVFGLGLSLAQIAGTVNFLVMEPIYDSINEHYKGGRGLGVALFVAAVPCLVSLWSGLMLGFMNKGDQNTASDPSNQKVKLTDVARFKGTFWLLTIVCVAFYCANFPFIGLDKDFFVTKFHFSDQQANTINSLVNLLAAFTSPFLGFLIDRVGKNMVWILASILVSLSSHSLLAFTFWSPYFGMVLMALACTSLTISLWPLISLIVPEHQLGIAFGVCQSFENLGLAVFSILGGHIVQKYSYTSLEIFFISTLGIALLAAILLWFIDLRQSGILNLSAKCRSEREENLSAKAHEKSKLLESTFPNYTGLQPTIIDIRNRYLSKIGVPHYPRSQIRR